MELNFDFVVVSLFIFLICVLEYSPPYKHTHLLPNTTKFYLKIQTKTFLLQKQSPEVLYSKRCSKKFCKFIGKHLCQSLFFNKVAGLRPIKTAVLKIFEGSQKNTWVGVFFNKVAGLNACNFIMKKDSNAGVFLWILRNF